MKLFLKTGTKRYKQISEMDNSVMKSDSFHSTKNVKDKINGQIMNWKEIFAMIDSDKRVIYTI